MSGQHCRIDMNGYISRKYMATHSFFPRFLPLKLKNLALVVVVLLLPLVGGCGFPIRYHWPNGQSPDAVRQQLGPGVSPDAIRAALGQPYQTTEITHTWFATFYDVSDPRFPIVQHESRDEFWIRGSEEFLWLFPPGHQSIMTAYEVVVDYDGSNKVTRFEIAPPGGAPKPPPGTQQ